MFIYEPGSKQRQPCFQLHLLHSRHDFGSPPLGSNKKFLTAHSATRELIPQVRHRRTRWNWQAPHAAAVALVRQTVQKSGLLLLFYAVHVHTNTSYIYQHNIINHITLLIITCYPRFPLPSLNLLAVGQHHCSWRSP